ncbi:MAG: sodium:calcium antiporter [Acidimicrobiales bacterium]
MPALLSIGSIGECSPSCRWAGGRDRHRRRGSVVAALGSVVAALGSVVAALGSVVADRTRVQSGEPGSLVGIKLGQREEPDAERRPDDRSAHADVTTASALGLNSIAVAIPVLAIATLVSLLASGTLVRGVEQVAEHLSLSDAAVGLIAALCADAPEITSAVTALAHGQADVGAGVVLGSNVFNLAAVLGLATLVSGRIALQRRAMVIEGSVAAIVATAGLLSVLGIITPAIGLLIGGPVFLGYAVLISLPESSLSRLGRGGPSKVEVTGDSDQRPGRPVGWASALRQAERPSVRGLFDYVQAARKEAAEAAPELAPSTSPRGRVSRDAGMAGIALVVVIAASFFMERTASDLGTRLGIPGIVTGAIVLAVLAALPNTVAAMHLASRRRGAAVVSEAVNSTNLNLLIGLLVPGAVIGLGSLSGSAALSAGWYTALVLGGASLLYARPGLGRVSGGILVVVYAVFVVVLALVVGAGAGTA